MRMNAVVIAIGRFVLSGTLLGPHRRWIPESNKFTYIRGQTKAPLNISEISLLKLIRYS